VGPLSPNPTINSEKMPVPEDQIPAGTWIVDPVHSSVEFQARNLGIVTVKGFFEDFEGTLESDGTLEGTRARGRVATRSIHTRSAPRDEHLRQADFLEAETYPDITFESTRVEPADGGFNIFAKLTMKGHTRDIRLTAVPQGTVTDPWGNERVGIEATCEIDRRDFGIDYSAVAPGGAAVVGNRVRIFVNLGAVKQTA
jgi:polyisoprenoid-binding protein YceI